MREIKFRVWDPNLDNGRMLYFDNFEEIVDWQDWDEWKLENSPMRNVDYMQFTGLLDKNGKEIYEGDIVKCTDGDDEVSEFNSDTGIGVVEWLEKWGFWNISVIENGLGDILNVYDVEVIGNIHENPELVQS